MYMNPLPTPDALYNVLLGKYMRMLQRTKRIPYIIALYDLVAKPHIYIDITQHRATH